MKTKEINNVLIAELMGGKGYRGFSGYEYLDFYDENSLVIETVRIDNLKYYTRWDWLIPVLTKIESLGYATNIQSGPDKESYCTIKQGNYRRGYGESEIKIVATWLAVVEFIKWYKSSITS